jgi:membrane-bound lytic murein transglycosylase A
MRAANLRSLAVLFALASPMDGVAGPVLERVPFEAIEGWRGYDFKDSFAAFRRSCAEIIEEGQAFRRPVLFGGERADWEAVCAKAVGAESPRAYFEENFIALKVSDAARPEGLFTGYFEPEAEGNLAASGKFNVPVYRKPHDLVAFDAAQAKAAGLAYGRIADGRPQGYFTRREIEEGALEGRGLEIVWLKDWADAFFIHIQGSGRARLPDGTVLRLAYAAKTGQPYTGIGGVLVERGILSKENMSMQAIRRWMAADPDAGRALMQENKSFVFFRVVAAADPELGPPGAQKVNLTPLHSLAVDRSIWMFGTPFWIETEAPKGGKARHEMFRELMIAQDTGTAIKGYVRGDVFWGSGPEAALTAGHMKSPGRMVALLPKALAERLLESP